MEALDCAQNDVLRYHINNQMGQTPLMSHIFVMPIVITAVGNRDRQAAMV